MQDTHTEFTAREVRHTLRRRTAWHRAMRYSGVTLLIAYVVFFCLKLKSQLAYQDTVNAIPASAHVGGTPIFTVYVEQYENGPAGQSEESRLVTDHMQLYRASLDSLGLSSKVLGFTLAITVVPFHAQGVRRCTSQLGVYSTDCGCERDSLDYTVLVIDTSGKNVDVTTSHLVSSASVQP